MPTRFITDPHAMRLGRNFQVIYEQASAHGQKVQTAGSNMYPATAPWLPLDLTRGLIVASPGSEPNGEAS